MEVRRLCDIFYSSVDDYRKPEHLKSKDGAAWRAISSAEFRQAVEELSLGALNSAEDRGTLFVGPGVEVYEGMVVGENTRG